MNEKMPRTPFSTSLSGSAKEVELRLKNIFSGPKKRPPLPFLILMFAVCVFCGNLVSCHVSEQRQPDSPDASNPGSSAVEPADESARWMLYWEEVTPKLLAQREDYMPGDPLGEVILNMTGEDLNLLLVGWSASGHTGGFYNLLLGTFDQEGNPVDFFDIGGDAGLWSAWDEADGLHLICTNTGTWQGWESGGAPMHFLFDGNTLEVVDAIPPSPMSAPAMPQRLSEWEGDEFDCKYLPIPGAVEVYRRTPGWDNISAEWQYVPQWEYQGTVSLTTAKVDPTPAAVRDAARAYVLNATLSGDWSSPRPTPGTPLLRLEQMAEWTDFSQLSLCAEWKNKENLTLEVWDADFGEVSEDAYYYGYAHLLFLREGEERTYLTSFYDGYPLETAPEPDLLAGLSPYNWYAVEALYDAGYLTARPKLANIFTEVPAPRQAEELARAWLDANDPGATITAMEPRFFCVEEPHWMGIYALKSSRFQNGKWEQQPARLAFFKLSSFRTFEMCVYMLPEAEVTDIEKQARAAAHGLVDYDVALWDLQYPDSPTAYGPGNYDGVFTAQGSEEHGNTWTEYGDRYTAQYRYGGWNNRFCTSLDTTRRLPTTRGIKVGDSRAKVRAAYPEIKDGPHPGYEGDCLWYEGYRTELIFFFENDAVSRLVLAEVDVS